jgi:hypothetical protein
MDTEALKARARFSVGDPVHWRGGVYRITARYWKRSLDWIVYDLMEVVAPGRSPRAQRRVREVELDVPSVRTLGVDRFA